MAIGVIQVNALVLTIGMLAVLGYGIYLIVNGRRRTRRKYYHDGSAFKFRVYPAPPPADAWQGDPNLRTYQDGKKEK